MAIRIIKRAISREELQELATMQFGDFIKAVVDVDQGIMAIGGELHADEEVFLVEHEESKREHMWGVNLYPRKTGNDAIEFDSMINLKPSSGNRSRSVESKELREKIRQVIEELVQP